MAIIELVDYNETMLSSTTGAKTKTRRRSRKKTSDAAVAEKPAQAAEGTDSAEEATPEGDKA
jgi:large subunit ribosomal protein L17